MKTALNAITAAAGAMTTGNAKTATTAAKEAAPAAMRNITAAIAAPAMTTTSCAMIAETVWKTTANVTINAADATRWAELSVRNVEKNVPNVPTGSAIIVKNVRNAQGTKIIAPFVIFAATARIGYAIAAEDVRIAP